MNGLDPNFMMHNLVLCDDAKPIQKKLRKMHPNIDSFYEKIDLEIS